MQSRLIRLKGWRFVLCQWQKRRTFISTLDTRMSIRVTTFQTFESHFALLYQLNTEQTQSRNDDATRYSRPKCVHHKRCDGQTVHIVYNPSGVYRVRPRMAHTAHIQGVPRVSRSFAGAVGSCRVYSIGNEVDCAKSKMGVLPHEQRLPSSSNAIHQIEKSCPSTPLRIESVLAECLSLTFLYSTKRPCRDVFWHVVHGRVVSWKPQHPHSDKKLQEGMVVSSFVYKGFGASCEYDCSRQSDCER